MRWCDEAQRLYGSRLKHQKMALWVASAAAVMLCIYFAWQYEMLHLRVKWADGQVAIFHEMAEIAKQMDSEKEEIGALQYVGNYYPSDTKQERGGVTGLTTLL